MTAKLDKITKAYVAKHGIEVTDDESARGYFTCAADQPCPPKASVDFIDGWNECDDELRHERA